MKLLKGWSCEFMIAPEDALTVGQKFAALCKGSTPIPLDSKVEILNAKEEDMYKLVLVRSKFKSQNELFLSLTSWKVGSHDLKVVAIKSNENVIVSRGPKFTVKSTLEKETKMNMPPGPALVSLPEFLWYVLGLTIFIAAILLVRAYRSSRQHDRGMLKLNTLKTSLKPYFEFQKQIRSTKKSLETNLTSDQIKNLFQSFYKSLVTYMSLEVKSPLFVLNDKKAKKVLRKKITDVKLVQDYFYIAYELKKSTFEMNEKSDVSIFKDDLENLLDESMLWSKKLNQHFAVNKDGVNK